MGILTDDDSLLDAALSEIVGLPIHERHERDPERDVTYLLMQHHLGQVSHLRPHQTNLLLIILISITTSVRQCR